MICITTILGYLGKYLINLFMEIFLIHIYGNNYNKRDFLFYLIYLYAISLVFSILLYQLYKVCIFEYDSFESEDSEGKEKGKEIKICEKYGYIIYSEKKKPKVTQGKNCCKLCCESFQNCCNKTACNIVAVLNDSCGCYYCCCDCGVCVCCEWFIDSECYTNFVNSCMKPKCYCSLCEYDTYDYAKDQEVFRYCYKAQRKSYWCNKFVTNETQKKFFLI